MVLSLLIDNNLCTKCHSLFLFISMTQGIQKLAMDLCVFPSQMLVLKNVFFSIKLCFRQLGIQPNISVIFWVIGRIIADFDRQAYKDGVVLF